MITSRNNRFLKGRFCGLLIAVAILCGAFAAQAAGTLGGKEPLHQSGAGARCNGGRVRTESHKKDLL